MKNKFCYILVGILFSFSFMNNVFAEGTLDFTVTTDVSATDVVVGDEVTIKVGVKSDTYIHACEFVVESDSNVSFVSINGVNNYSADKGEEKISVMDSRTSGDAPTDGINIMQLTYKINGDGKLTIKTDECVSWDGNEYGTYEDITINFTTKELSADTTLKSVKINGQEVDKISPNGSTAFVLENPNFSLEYETTNPDYMDDVVVKMNGNVITELNNIVWSDPSNQKIAQLELIVNNVTTYSIGVYYEGENLDNSLKSLKINGETVNLVSGQTNYTIKIGKDITSVKIEVELTDGENFRIDEPFENGVLNHTILGNSSSVQIDVVPINDQIGGSSVSYVIKIEKEGGSASSSTVKPSTSKPTSAEIEENPPTGDISMFVMALILISSLVGSVLLYQKNIEGYK